MKSPISHIFKNLNTLPLKLSKNQIPLNSNCLIIVKDGDQILQKTSNFTLFFKPDRLNLTKEEKDNAIFIGELYNKQIYAVEKSGLCNEKSAYIKFSYIMDKLNHEELKTLYRSCHLLNWHKQSRFCGHCGGHTHIGEKEFVKVCDDNAKHLFYPQYSPSMIVLIRHQDKLLLGRSLYAEKPMYSTLAGFVEAGEAVEEAVRREVMEEVGLELKNIVPLLSTPWPFPGSMMLGYVAEPLHEPDNAKLVINHDELKDAQWFHFNDLPMLPPKSTIAYRLIEYGIQEYKKSQNSMITPASYE